MASSTVVWRTGQMGRLNACWSACWTFHTIPQKGEAGYDTWLEGSAEYSGAANVWGGIAYDAELGYVYMGTSTPNSDFYGGMRPGDNLFAESIVCLDATTGRRIWHF